MERTCRLILVGLLIATAAQTATAAYNIADLNKDGIVDMVDLAIFADNWQSMAYFPDPDITFVPIGAVTFLMGDETGYGGSNEKPVHAVTLDAFEISKYEVTNHQYALFLNSAKVNRLAKVVNGIVYDAGDADNTEPWFKTYAAESDSSISYSGGVFGVRNSDGKDMKAHPVREVTWFGAKAFCDYYGWRLPTEAEWECAARGGYHDPYGKYPWGSDDINGSRCNYGGNTPPPRTTPVGNYPAWGYGICDMAGNVYEWCNDWYAADYYAVSPAQNPGGPDSGSLRVLRGGNWLTIANGCRVAYRFKNSPDANGDYGFRPVRDLTFADKRVDPDVRFVPVAAVTFLMGDETGQGGLNEKPVHAVTLDAFEIGKYEVTNHQYAFFLNSARTDRLTQVVNGIVYEAADADHTEPWFKTYAAESNSSIFYSDGVFSVRNSDGKDMNAHPVREVTWFGAKAFCDYYGWRLPTEAEWECAARGGYHDPYGKYPWGSDDINGSRCNYGGNTPPPRTTPVGNYPAWGYGICDMAGNVYEWCNDWYAADYYAVSPANNPGGPDSGSLRVLRGGNWLTIANGCRVAYRFKNSPDANGDYGFRPVRDL